MRTVAIAGVGLIGGSFGLALRAAGYDGRILGVSSPATIAKATAAGAIDRGVSLEQAVDEADLLLLAQPIHVILETIDRLSGRMKPGVLVTDVGSTKRRIVEHGRAALGASFLGAHPMAGKESRGVGAAEPELFRGRPWLVTPVEQNELDALPHRQFLVWLKRIGAHVIVCSPADHDRWVARSSHLPQLLSTTLARTLDEREDREAILGAAGPGLTSMTRLALSSWPIWKDILETNGDSIAEALGEFQAALSTTARELKEGRLEESFARGAQLAGELLREP
jgi:prephenate dehydrogenase